MKKNTRGVKKILSLALFVLFAVCAKAQNNGQAFNRSAFYDVMSADNIAEIDEQLSTIAGASFDGKPAFEGTLIMKKAGLVKGAKKKLDLFKKGHKKLESALDKDSSNAEYRFLRLMIQENAPGILGYKKDLQRDKELIKKSYKNLPPLVQQAIVRYSKKSKVLQPKDF